jgi:mono/diheme cytochrome c family protein
MKSHVFCRLAGVCLFVVGLGCGKSDPTTSDAPPMDPGAMGGTPTGNAVFDANCLGCHSASASSTPMRKKGPNLSKVGADHTVDWLAEHVKNPKSHKKGSMMPEFASKLTAEEITSVSEFMAGLK